MSSTSALDIEVPSETTRAVILLDVEYFDLITRVLGFDDDTARGYFLGMHPVSVTRARKGRPVGHPFIANTIVALRRHAEELAKYNLTVSMDRLFTIADEESGQ